jgi:ketosteroid isomerase-like protein
MRGGVRLVAGAVACALLGGTTMAGPQGPDARVVAETERAFAKRTGEVGVRDGFLEFIAADAVIFRPRPVAGRPALEKAQKRPGLLTWYPTVAGISQAGDMGYTTGPSEFRANGPSDAAVHHGHFVTVWRRQPGGAWKFAVDIGTGNDAPASKEPEWTAPTGPAATSARKPAAPPDDPRAAQQGAAQALADADREFSRLASVKGLATAYETYLAEDGRVHRDEHFPAVGRAAGVAAVRAEKRAVTWNPTKAEVAASGDIGYTLGLSQLRDGGAGAAEGVYLRIWSREKNGRWRVLIDVMKDLPTQ